MANSTGFHLSFTDTQHFWYQLFKNISSLSQQLSLKEIITSKLNILVKYVELNRINLS